MKAPQGALIVITHTPETLVPLVPLRVADVQAVLEPYSCRPLPSTLRSRYSTPYRSPSPFPNRGPPSAMAPRAEGDEVGLVGEVLTWLIQVLLPDGLGAEPRATHIAARRDSHISLLRAPPPR
jgi:hypothetical protein